MRILRAGGYPSPSQPTESSARCSTVRTMPAWLTFFLAIGTPLLAFAGSLTGAWWSRRSAIEEDVWRHREETMRMLRWGVELGTSGATRPGAAGIAALRALVTSKLVQADDRRLVRAVAEAVFEPDRTAYDEARVRAGEGPAVEVEEEAESG